VPAPLIRSVTGKRTRSKPPPNAYFCRSAAVIFRFRTRNAHGSASSSMIIAVGLPAPWPARLRRGARPDYQWMMTNPAAVATAVGNPHTRMPRSTRPRCSVASRSSRRPARRDRRRAASRLPRPRRRACRRSCRRRWRGACAICGRPAGTITCPRTSSRTLSPSGDVTYARNARRQGGWRRARTAARLKLSWEGARSASRCNAQTPPTLEKNSRLWQLGLCVVSRVE